MRTGETRVPNAESTLAFTGKMTSVRLQQICHATGVDWTGAAEGNEGHTTKVNAHLDSVHARRSRHVLVHDFVYARCCIDCGEAETLRDCPCGSLCQRCIEWHVAAEEPGGVEQPNTTSVSVTAGMVPPLP